MKKYFVSTLLFSMLFFSCSKDKNNDAEGDAPDAILGTWKATEFKINLDTATDNAVYAKGILDYLTNKDCYIITLQFNQDLTAKATSSASYLQVNTTSTGFDIPCPTNSDVESTTYSYEMGVVTFVNLDGDVTEVAVNIDGDMMTVNAADLEIPDFNEEGQLVFQRN